MFLTVLKPSKKVYTVYKCNNTITKVKPSNNVISFYHFEFTSAIEILRGNH